jgi:uncharacterized protein YndB with AHSA1/START domain
MIDVTEQISSVRRQVGSRTLEAGEGRTVTISQVYNTDVDDLWEACTTAERIPRWFLPITGELRVGGQYQLEGNAGGMVERCDPPKSFAATWEFAGQVSWIEVRITAEDNGRARFELEHTMRVDDHWDQFGPGAVGVGYDMMLIGLTLHLTSSGATVDPAEAMAWFSGPEGTRFVRESNEAWYQAHVTSGAPEDVARAQADRNLAAYTAPPETP